MMKILFIHQNFPGQFLHLAPALVKRGHQIYALTIQQSSSSRCPGVKIFTHAPNRGTTPNVHPWVSDFETKTIRGESCFRACLRLKKDGFSPDLIVSHPGWGESLFVKDVWPEVKLAIYCEFFYSPYSKDCGFDPEFPPADDSDSCRLRLKNTNNILHFQIADAGISPTRWQADTFPQPFSSKISIIHDGIDTDKAISNKDVLLKLSVSFNDQITRNYSLSRKNEVITFVNRNLEPYRGYHIFMRSLPELLKRRPEAYVLIIGGNGVSYGSSPPQGSCWKDIFMNEVRSQMSNDEINRILFLGTVPYDSFLKVLQLSTVHVYLTYPFVLSWSLLEAMSSECAIVASNTEPLREVIDNNVSGKLINFFDKQALVNQICELLDNEDLRIKLGKNARSKIIKNYSLNKCLSKQVQWIENM